MSTQIDYGKGYLLSWLLSALLIITALGAEDNAKAKKVIVSEITLRKIALKTVMPDFPDVARKRKSRGVAVAQLGINENGDVIEVTVLEVPHPVLTDAVSKAVKLWKFKPLAMDNKQVLVQGKLTFYYVIDQNGVGRVENPRRYQ
jgi:TonB family protein